MNIISTFVLYPFAKIRFDQTRTNNKKKNNNIQACFDTVQIKKKPIKSFRILEGLGQKYLIEIKNIIVRTYFDTNL